jgi:RNA polymerase sigma-70 factor (ECF subfamily)
MSGLDMQYIAELVRQAQDNDANAFAELFAATYQKQYAFARGYLQDDFMAQEALQETCVQALKTLYRLREPEMVVVWLNHITLKTCFAIRRKYDSGNAPEINPENRMMQIGGRQYNVRQIMTLPFSEAQTILLKSLCGMKARRIADLLEIRRSAVRRYADSGIRRLRQLSETEGGVRS